MNKKIENHFEKFHKNNGILKSEIVKIISKIGNKIPNNFIDLYEYMESGEGFIGNNYFRLYPLRKINQINESFKTSKFNKDIFIFGSNGGGEAFAFFYKKNDISIIRIPFIPLDNKYAIELGKTLEEFIIKLSENKSNHQEIDKSLINKEIMEKKPVIFGGDPSDKNNKIVLSLEEYSKLVIWWNEKYLELIK